MLTLNQSNSFMPGVYIKQATVIGAEDISGKPTYADLPESIRDLAVEVEFNIGKEWTKKVIFKGNLKLVDPKNPKSIDWGGAFVVRDFFTKTDCFNDLTKEEIAEKLKSFSHKDIPADFLVKVRNKQVFLLDYVKDVADNGKLKYGTWNIVDTNEDRLKAQFKASLSRGYPRNYKPELLNQQTEEDASFGYGANVNESVSDNSNEDFPF